MKISIVGWYGMKNVGDEAFRSVLPQFFVGHDVEFVTPPNECNSPDIVVLGGGAVASPFYLNYLPDCPRYALGIDIAYTSEIDLLAEANFKGIYVRNSTDLQQMREKLTCPVHSIPDLAFLLAPSGNCVLQRYSSGKKPCVGVMATDYVNPAIDRDVERFAARSWSFQTNMARELDQLQLAGYEVVLIPCSTGGYGDDRRMNLGIAAFMKTRPTNIMDTLSPQETIDLIAEMQVTLCMRFHAHVFSIIAGAPFLSIDYTRKVELLLKENSLTETSAGCFKGSEFQITDLVERVKTMSNSLDSSLYIDIADRNRSSLHQVIRQVRQEWLQ